jgi:hypothetical protein
MGESATDEDYDSFVELVAARIDALCGFEVDVQYAGKREVQGTKISGYDSDADRQVVSDVLVELWENWCAGERGAQD